ncbi:MAG TPA: aspartate aminotransferase family protein, partial [Firmicutes bacterium]|nr:aspartate aminotransferase family protein [Bacillota bacterium]
MNSMSKKRYISACCEPMKESDSMSTMDDFTAQSMAEKIYLEGLELSPDEAIELIDTFIAHNYALLTKDPVIRAEGAWLYTKSGRTIFDGVAAYSAANLGHNHPMIVNMLRHFIAHQSPTVLGRFLPDPFMGLLGAKIVKMTGFEKFLPANGGVEAPEAALKLARRWGHRVKKVKGTPEIIYFTGCFHGRTLTVTQFFEEEVCLDGFEPFVPGFKKVKFGDMVELRNAVNENTIAILIEPIQGEGGINIPPQSYFPELHRLAREKNVLVIYDEVQTGWGRTGKLFAWEHNGDECRPDILCVGKSLSGGFAPISGILADSELMKLFEPGSHGSTFGGCPISSAIGLAALTAIEIENLPRQAELKGTYLLERLSDIASNSEHIAEVRGKGMMIGIEMKKG